jgi:signal transduction histidine kinase
MLREGAPIGAVTVHTWATPRPFSDNHVALLETFADQAVIAIENVRLFKELQARNAELTEALERQTATSEVLKVISRSAFDLQPILETVAENAVRLCGAERAFIFRSDGELLRGVATYNVSPELRAFVERNPIRPGRHTITARTALERRTIHVHDVQADPEYTYGAKDVDPIRTVLGIPMLRGDDLLGAIIIYRLEVRPFTDKQIELLQTFADQAVIAIENVRLFKALEGRTTELARSVEELKALGEVSQAVSSTLDLETVLRTVVARASQLAVADGGSIHEYDEVAQEFPMRATHNYEPELAVALQATPLRKGEGVMGRAAERREPMQVADIAQEGAYESRFRDVLLRMGYRALLTVPLVREDQLVGSLAVARKVPGEFSPEVITLLRTFATQSALAIQNARLFRELEEKSRQLEAASRHKSQFLANMSHELRTPLNAVLGYTELILDKIFGEVPEPIRDSLERARSSGQHLLGLINDVLDLSKIEAGQLTLSLSDYAMEEVVHAAVTAVESLATEKKLALSATVPAGLPTGKGDSRRLTQVLLNLLGNAIKFTEVGGIRVEVAAADGAFRVSVSDTGPGISEADQQRIFEEFRQADSSTTRKKGGTGLGLTIAKRIIELHGGRIWVESSPGTGSTFRLTLPVRVERPGGGA